MSENKKMKIVLLGISLILLLIPLTIFVSYFKSNKIVTEINSVFNEKEPSLVYLGSESCSYSNMFNPIVYKASTDYKFPIYYVDMNSLFIKQYKDILEKFDLNYDDFGTPYIAVVQEGRKLDELKGMIEEDELLIFLQDNGVITEDLNFSKNDEKLNLLNFSNYLDLIKKDENTIIVYSSSTCPACSYAKPFLNKVAEKLEVPINYLEIDKIDNSDFSKFYESLDTLGLDRNDFGTPTLVIVKNEKVVDFKVGALNEEGYTDFLKKYYKVG